MINPIIRVNFKLTELRTILATISKCLKLVRKLAVVSDDTETCIDLLEIEESLNNVYTIIINKTTV